MVSDQGTLTLRIEAETNKATSNLNKFNNNIETCVNSITNFERHTSNKFNIINSHAKNLTSRISTLTGSFIRLSSIIQLIGIASISHTADKYNMLQYQIKTVTESQDEYLEVSKKLNQVTSKTGIKLKQNIKIFQSLARLKKPLGLTNDEIIRFSKTIGQIGQISGMSANQLELATTQVAHALYGGRLNTIELQSLLNNAPEIVNQLATGLKMTIGELREATSAGKISAGDFFEGIINRTINIEEQAKAVRSLHTSFTRLSETLKRITSKTFGWVPENLSIIIDNITDAIIRIEKAIGRLRSSENKRSSVRSLPRMLGGAILSPSLTDLRTEMATTQNVLEDNLEEEVKIIRQFNVEKIDLMKGFTAFSKDWSIDLKDKTLEDHGAMYREMIIQATEGYDKLKAIRMAFLLLDTAGKGVQAYRSGVAIGTAMNSSLIGSILGVGGLFLGGALAYKLVEQGQQNNVPISVNINNNTSQDTAITTTIQGDSLDVSVDKIIADRLQNRQGYTYTVLNNIGNIK